MKEFQPWGVPTQTSITLLLSVFLFFTKLYPPTGEETESAREKKLKVQEKR